MNIIKILIAIVLGLILLQIIHSNSMLKRPDVSYFAEARINHMISVHDAMAECLKNTDMAAADIYRYCEDHVGERMGEGPQRENPASWGIPRR